MIEKLKPKKQSLVGWVGESLKEYSFVTYFNRILGRRIRLPVDIRLEQTKKRVLEKSSEATKVRITIEEIK